jgi:hydrogenase maturation protease
VDLVREQVRRNLPAGDRPDFDFVSLGGIALMERLVGYRRAILVDAIEGGNSPGSVRCFPLDALPRPDRGHTASVHDASLPTALDVGRAAGAALPAEITVVSIEAATTREFTERLSDRVAAAIPAAARMVMDTLRNWSGPAVTPG